MSTFISGVANPMTEALYKPPPRKPHIRTPPKTPHSMIRGDFGPPKMTKEERRKFIERKREELAAEAHGRKESIGDAIKERTDAFVTHENVPPVLDYGALERGDIQAVLGNKFDALLQEYGHKPLNKTPMKGTKNTGAEASVN
tara:strand:- start:1214 stop:1642 length:429 start_codon:yes stop_codon:yes gene_type:complete